MAESFAKAARTKPEYRYRPRHPLVELVLARMREFIREPEVIFWVYGFPLLMVMALGIAFRSPPRAELMIDVVEGPSAMQTMAALHETDGPSSADLALGAKLVLRRVSAEESRLRLTRGKSALAVAAIPVADGGGYEYRYDPSRPESTLARATVQDRLQRAAGRRDSVPVRDTADTPPGGRYIDFLVPGLIGVSLMSGGLMGVGYVAIDMRVRNLLKRFVTTPMRRHHFLQSLMISRYLLMVTEVALVLLFARVFFGVIVQGSWLALAVILLLGAWTFASLGLLVASRAKTLEAASGLINLTQLPMWLLSGIFFSYDRFPAAIHPLIRLLPLTPLNDSLRAVMNEGASLASQTSNLAVLLVWSVVSFVLALRWFRWT